MMIEARYKHDPVLEQYLLELGQGDMSNLEHVFQSAFREDTEGKFLYENPYQQIPKTQAASIQSLIRVANVRNVLEIGTFVGFSSFSMAQAIKFNDGRVTSLEIEESHHKQAVENLASHKARYNSEKITSKLEYVLADAKEYMLQRNMMEKAKDIDLFFLDGDKCNYGFYYEWAVEHLRSGGLFVVDNALFYEAVYTDPTNMYASAIKEMTSRFKKEDKFDFRLEIVSVGNRDKINNPGVECMIVATKK